MITRSLFSILCLGAFLVTLAAPVWPASLDDVINALETPFQTGTDEKLRIYDYSADFSQESKIASLDRLQRASGEVEVAFDYQRTETVPRVKFHWQYEQPTTQEIVSDAKTLWVYLPENNQVIQSDIEDMKKSRQNDPMTFLTGLGNLSRDFSIHWAEPKQDVDGNYVLELIPRRVSSLINKLIIMVDRNAVEAYLNRGQNEAPGMQQPVPTPPRHQIQCHQHKVPHNGQLAVAWTPWRTTEASTGYGSRSCQPLFMTQAATAPRLNSAICGLISAFPR